MDPQLPQQQIPSRSFWEDAFEHTLNGFKVTRLLFAEIERAAMEVGYHEEDDEFDYDLTPHNILDLGMPPLAAQ
jgi:hypothetical protein